MFKRSFAAVIVSSRQFRNLQQKTQVYHNRKGGNGHKYRNRLTHSYEVAENARQVALHLGADGDLAYLLGLVHDIGHSPFGHKGGDYLDACLREATGGQIGFEHNNQSKRLLLQIAQEAIWEDQALLNRVYKGLAKRPEHGLTTPYNILESQIMDVCDNLTYTIGDMQDAFATGNLKGGDFDRMPFAKLLPKHLRDAGGSEVYHYLYRLLFDDLIQHSQSLLSRPHIIHTETAVVANSPEIAQTVKEMGEFMYENVYHSPERQKQDKQHEKIIRSVFGKIEANPLAISHESPSFAQRLDNWKRENQKSDFYQGISDYISGCDDMFIHTLYLSR